MPGKSLSDSEEAKQTKVHPDSVVCDSSSLIALTEAGLLGALISIKMKMKGDLFITKGVEGESIDYPINVPEYSFAAVRLKRALDSKMFKLIEYSVGTLDTVLHSANNMFYTDRPFHLVDEGEAEMIAAAVDNGLTTLLMDERTTRALIEAPMDLKKHLEEEFHIDIRVNQDMYSEFHKITENLVVIRSAEIIALANDKGYFKKYKELSEEAYEAALYAIKFKGCAIGFDEIKELAKLG